MPPAPSPTDQPYRGRIAPSPTGFLHLGHARTFWTAQERARKHNGTLVLRNEDLDRARCRPEFVESMTEDLRWFGLAWQEGPDSGGPHSPYNQSERLERHRAALESLKAAGLAYPCRCSRKDIQAAASAPQGADDEFIYPGTCRDRPPNDGARRERPATWRFRVPEGKVIRFTDGAMGVQHFVAGRDFGDFVLWRSDDVPAYQLAVAVDDHAMGITEVVRGADLLVSTARQLLIYQALGLPAPAFFHCPLLTDERGVRLAKRHDALSLRTLRARGASPKALRGGWLSEAPRL